MKRAPVKATKSVSHAGHVKIVLICIQSGTASVTGKVTVGTK